MLPAKLISRPVHQTSTKPLSARADVTKGAKLLFGNKLIRFSLAIEFISAIAGAKILVNTVCHIKNGLLLRDRQYGWVMAAFGIGAAIAAFVAGNLDKSKSRRVSLILGVLLLGLAIAGANYVNYSVLLILWLLAWLGQSLAEMPSETLIGKNIAPDEQGKVFGSHFAFSHLWWAIAYPIAGFTGSYFPGNDLFYGGVIPLGILIIALLLLKRNTNSLKVRVN